MWEYWLSFLKSGKVLYLVLLTQHYLVWFSAGEVFHVWKALSAHCCGLFLDQAAHWLGGSWQQRKEISALKTWTQIFLNCAPTCAATQPSHSALQPFIETSLWAWFVTADTEIKIPFVWLCGCYKTHYFLKAPAVTQITCGFGLWFEISQLVCLFVFQCFEKI